MRKEASLIVMRGVDEHHPGDLVGMKSGKKQDEQAAIRVSDEHVGGGKIEDAEQGTGL